MCSVRYLSSCIAEVEWYRILNGLCGSDHSPFVGNLLSVTYLILVAFSFVHIILIAFLHFFRIKSFYLPVRKIKHPVKHEKIETAAVLLCFKLFTLDDG